MSNVKINKIVDKHKLPKKCPNISWGQDFEDKSNAEKVAYLKKFADSFNHALDMMQQERDSLYEDKKALKSQVENLQKAVQQQRDMIQKSFQEQNEIKAVYNERVQALENKLREEMDKN